MVLGDVNIVLVAAILRNQTRVMAVGELKDKGGD